MLTGEGHASAVCELATTIATTTGTPIAYTDLPKDELAQALTGVGLPPNWRTSSPTPTSG